MDPASRLTSTAKTLYQNITGGSSVAASPQAEPTPPTDRSVSAPLGSSSSAPLPSLDQPLSSPAQPAQPVAQPQSAGQPQPVDLPPESPNSPESPEPLQPPLENAADGQFSPEEWEYLRQTGQLPQRVGYGSPLQESSLIPGIYKPLPEEILLEWIAPSRPFKKPKRVYFVNVTVIGILICLILFFANQFFVAAVVLALVFLVYVLNSISPRDVRHALTTYGIRNEDQLYYWEELGRFWITESKGQNVLHVEVARFPNRLAMLLGEIPADDMTVILSEVLLNEKPPLTQIERWGEWLKQRVPLDLEN